MRRRRDRDRLVEELRDRVHYLERMLEDEREVRTEERRRHDTLMAQLMQWLPELEAPTSSSEVRESDVSPGPTGALGKVREELAAEQDRREMAEATLREGIAAEQQRREEAERERDDLRRELFASREPPESPEPVEEEPGSAENSRNASAREPPDTVFTTLVPFSREQTAAKSTGLYRWWMKSPLEKYLSYAIGIVLTAASAGLDLFYSPEGVDISVRLFIAAAFGIYVGIKDGKKSQPVGRFNIIGALAGLLAWMVAAYVSQVTLLAAYDRGDISPIVSSVFAYLLGTWLIFMSGFLIGKALQMKAEEDRGRLQDGSSPSRDHEALAKGTRTTAIVGLVGVIGAALLQVIGEIVSALVGNSGP